MKFHFFCNPAAGRAKHFKKDDILRSFTGHESEFFISSGKKEIEERISSLESGVIPIVVGGDGTVNEAVNGLIKGQKPLKLGIIPSGTVNVLALELGIQPRLPDCITPILKNSSGQIDIGYVKTRETERYFVLMASIGLDAEIIRTHEPALKEKLGRAAYILKGLSCAFSYKPHVLQIKAKGRNFTADFCTLQNTRYYGGKFIFDGKTSVRDGLLNGVMFKDFSGLGLMLKLPLFLAGIKSLAYYAANDAFSIDSEKGAPIQTDGDFLGYTPADVSVIKNALSVFY